MDQKTFRELQTLASDLGALWCEAACVVGLRSLRLAQGGPKAGREAKLMVREKFSAQCRVMTDLATGKHGTNPLSAMQGATRFYLKGVRANRRRLMRG